jgi:16S rRNA G527 N7-methylase RsmG
LQPF